jgi:glucosamine-6-phosphate deaminase
MRIRIFSTPRTAARALARDLARTLRADPRLVLGLPTGRTPIPVYRELVALARAGVADFSRATTFNLDEFAGLPASHPSSYHAFMRRHLFDAVNLSPRRTHVLDGAAADAAAECARYERAIARAGGIDLLLLGLGGNGHIGFNEPAAALHAWTHRTRLTPATRRANAALFGGRASRVPRQALSMGMATILQARRIVLMATGRGKARAVQRMIEGPITTRVPASFLQLHPNAEVWLDRDATRGSADLSAGVRRPRRSRRAPNRARGAGG